MPGINIVKNYKEGGIYHVYNRGVNKEPIFSNKDDYSTFFRLLNHYLLPSDKSNFYGRIEFMGVSLIPNHFHFQLQQKGRHDMVNFMQSLITSYSMRINNKYERVGHLFQGTYRARMIENNDDLVNTSFYIHNNPKDELGANPFTYPYSSIGSYDGSGRGFVFVKERPVLDLFESAEDYINGLKNYKKSPTHSGLDLR